MDDDKKLAFIANMTDRALHHVASTPNAGASNGGMSHEKMLSFISAMTKHGLQHFDAGGTALGGPSVTTSGTRGVTPGLSMSATPGVPGSITSQLPSSVQSGLSTLAGLNPLNAIQAATQN